MLNKTNKTKASIKYLFFSVFICYFSVVGYAQNTKPIKADILLDKTLLNESSIDAKLINSIEYTSKGFVLLSSANQFYVLGIGGVAPIFNKWSGKTGIESFTVTAKGVLMIVSGKTMYQAHSKPSFLKVMDIPDSDMGITSKYKNVYLFDRKLKSNKKDYSIYQISTNKKIIPLVKIPTPVLSLFEQPSQLIFSTKNIVFSVDIKTKKLYQMLALPQENDIISIVGDTINHAFYFSTDQSIYQLKDDKIEMISNDFGGILKYDGKGLSIFNPEKSLIIRLRNNILYPASAKKEELPPLVLNKDETPEDEDLTRLLNEPRTMILAGQIPQAIQTYAQLAKKENPNTAIFSEYAYALALGGVYDGALVNLDMARYLGAFSERDYFYAGQVFALMGPCKADTCLLKQSAVPKWIYPKYGELYQKYRLDAPLPQRDSLQAVFNRANNLAALGLNFQSMYLFDELTKIYPEEFLFHVGYSIPLEKAGLREVAANELETGIRLMPDTSIYAEARTAFTQRLDQLSKPTSEAKVLPELVNKLKKFNPKTMLYFGGMLSKDYKSLDGRFGVYLSDGFNASLNMGISGNSAATYFNIGLSGYRRLGKVFVVGLGLNEQAGNGSGVLSVVPTVGVSLVNPERYASWDFFLNIYCPLQKDASTVYGFSIGRSFYLGTRKKGQQ